MGIANYCPDDVTCLIWGKLVVDGYVDGTFIDIEKDVQPSTAVRTPDGTVARVKNTDNTYTIRMTLHNGSTANEVLTKLWQVDDLTGGRFKFPMFVKDHSGTDLFFSTSTWIESPPTLSKSASVDGRTWTFRSAFATINIGGNGDVSDLIEDLTNSILSGIGGLA